MDYRFTKAERLNSRLAIDKLFAGGNASTVAFPLRIVYMKVEAKKAEMTKKTEVTRVAEEEATIAEVADNADMADDAVPPVSVLVSVPKKRFRHAVDRNRMKRLVREAYRLNKHILWEALEGKEYKLAVAFVCITDQLPTFYAVNKSMLKVLTQISERLNK